MVSMRNITERNNRITADCYKEGRAECYFSIVLDARTFEIIDCSLKHPGIYAGQAAAKLESLSKKGPLPGEAVSVWC